MILLDTCTFLWLNEDPVRLPPSVLEKIRGTPVGYRFVSAMSALEIAVKIRRGRLILPGSSPRIWFDAVVAERGLAVLPMTAGIALRSGTLPDLHADPADRVIVATAMEHGLTILTPDALIRAYADMAFFWS